MQSFCYLINGSRGTGKTDLATYLACKSGAKQIKLVKPDRLLSLSLDRQLAYLEDVFANAKRADLSVIILDDLEGLIGADVELRVHSNLLRLKFEALLKSLEDSKNKVIVIATTRNADFIKRVELYDLFSESVTLGRICLTNQNANVLIPNLLNTLGLQVECRQSQFDDKELQVSLSMRELVYKLKKFNASLAAEAFDVQKFLTSLIGANIKNDHEVGNRSHLFSRHQANFAS